MSLACSETVSCPFQFECINSVCMHSGIFPLTIYTSFVYLLLTFGVMLSNVAGLSAGIFKIPILMDMLNYPVINATSLSYPIVTGASLANFILIIPKRHMTRCTSLVDYNIVLILTPSVIFGSILGVILVKFIPILYQDITLIMVSIMFTLFFAKKYKECKSLADIRRSKQIEEPLFAQLQPPLMYSERAETLSNQNPLNNDKISMLTFCLQSSNRNTFSEQLNVHMAYEKGYHAKDIIISLTVFVVFEVLSLFSQGKFMLRFGFCTWIFCVSFGAFCLLVIGYMIIVYRLTCKKLKYYKTIGYHYDVKLNKVQNYMILVCGGFIGGLLQGIIGVGSGNMMVWAMLVIGIDPKVTTATSGYQIVFVGAASLIEAIANQLITWTEAGWLFGICFIIGGSLTVIFYTLTEGRPTIQRTILLIVTLLCVISVVGTIPSIVLTQKYYGWQYMLTVHDFCE